MSNANHEPAMLAQIPGAEAAQARAVHNRLTRHHENQSPRNIQQCVNEKIQQHVSNDPQELLPDHMESFLMNHISDFDVPNWHGQAGQLLHDIGIAQQQVCDTDSWITAAQQLQEAVDAAKGRAIKEYVRTSRLMSAHFRWFPDQTIIVTTDWGGWSQVLNPALIHKLENEHQREIDWLANCRQEEPTKSPSYLMPAMLQDDSQFKQLTLSTTTA